MKKLLLAAAVVLLLSTACRAQDVADREAQILNTDSLRGGLSAEQTRALGELTPTNVSSFGSQIWRVVTDALGGSGSALRAAAASAGALLAAGILCSFVLGMETTYSGRAVKMAGTLAITAVCAADLRSMMGLASSALDGIANFSALLLPVLSSAAAASGAVGSSAALYVGSSLFVSVLSSAIRSLLVPLVYAFAALAAAECAMGDSRLAGIRKLLGWAVQTSLRLIMYGFTGYLALTGILAGSADAVTVKAAKTALSGAIPVVGGIAADASETVLAGAALLKNSVGIFGMAAVLAIGLAPFFRIGACYLTLRLTAALSGVTACREHAALLDHLAAAMGYMLAMTGCCVLMALVSCCCFVKVVTG